MKHTYHIHGMTCQGCRDHVEKILNTVPGVIEAKVDLEKEEAVISMDGKIETESFQKLLSPKYNITDKANITAFQMTSHSMEAIEEKSKLEQLRPLLLILFYIALASVLLHYDNWDSKAAMLDFMGLFFLVFSFFKMLDLKNFPDSFRMYDLLAKRVSIYGWIYPFIETALGLMFLMRFEIEIALIVTLIILSITSVGVAKTLLNKKAIRCACLGTVLKLPMTEATIIENAIMIVMSIIMLTQII